jgi:hypothetical protein
MFIWGVIRKVVSAKLSELRLSLDWTDDDTDVL